MHVARFTYVKCARVATQSHPQEGYAYILTHPGTPCVFVDHISGDGNLRKVGARGRARTGSTLRAGVYVYERLCEQDNTLAMHEISSCASARALAASTLRS